MIYIDTSALVKLYIKEPDSRQLSEWIRENNQPIPLTPLIHLELINALQLKQFRKEISKIDFDKINSRIQDHEQLGVYFRPPMDWPRILTDASGLSNNHTQKTGSRSLDILHVASALFLQSEAILTFDEKQAQLADAAGLKVQKYR